jgi:hypothetical protein
LPIYVFFVGRSCERLGRLHGRRELEGTNNIKVSRSTQRRSQRQAESNQYQTVTVSEPIELQAYQAVDEFNRAFNMAPPSGFVQPPYLVTRENVNEAGGTKNIFVPDNDYKRHYLQIWGIGS